MTGNLTRFDRRLSPADQRTIVVKATRTTSQGRAARLVGEQPAKVRSNAMSLPPPKTMAAVHSIICVDAPD
jgi:hypothetical protein